MSCVKLKFNRIDKYIEVHISMKTVFDAYYREQLIGRIEQIHENSSAVWGKMNVGQMVQHNTYWNRWMLGADSHTYKQAFLGKIFGKIALKRMVKDDKPFDKNIPSSEQFKARGQNNDIAADKLAWIVLLRDYENYRNPDFVHDFFGKMTKEEIGVLVYKHTDHHLRQFGL